MKKYLFIMSAAALALASCSEEQELVNAPASQENRVLTATFEQDAATRTSIGANNALTWSADDAIAVFGESAIKYNLSDASAGTFVIEENADAPESITGAAFPYAENVALSSNTLTMTLPATIDQTAAGELDLPMWGTVTDGRIAFKHLAGVLKVNLTTNLPEAANYNTLIVTASNPISGYFTVDVSEDYPTLASESTDEKDKTVTVSFTEATTLYLPLPVGTYESIEVSVSDGDENTKVLKKFSNITVERAKVYKTTVTDYTSVMTAEELVAAVAEGGEVTLGANITIDELISIVEEQTVNINLNGYTLTGDFDGYCFENAGNLTITNGYITNKGGAVKTTGGNLTMTDCKVTVIGGGTEFINAVEVTEGTIATITDGWYKSEGTLADGVRNDFYGIGIVAGTVTLNTTVEGFNGGVTLAPVKPGTPDVTITGGSYSGELYYGLNMNGGKLTLNGEPQFSGSGGDIRVYTLTGTINDVSFGSRGNKTYTLNELMSYIDDQSLE